MSSLRFIQEIPLPGVLGRLDHLSYDKKGKRLFLSCLGNDSVQVIDIFGGLATRLINNVEGKLSRPQGVCYCDSKIFVANSKNGKVNIFDGNDYTLVKQIDFSEEPDNLRYDSSRNCLYVGFGEGELDAIDLSTCERSFLNIKLNAHPEGFQVESRGPRIFVNVADSRIVSSINRDTGEALHFALPADCSNNFPMALDEDGRRIFVVARSPPCLLVLCADTGRNIARVPCGADSDDVFFDARRAAVYVVCGEGVVSVVRRCPWPAPFRTPHHDEMYHCAEQVPTAVGARTGLWLPDRDRLIVAAPATATVPARLLVLDAAGPLSP